MNSNLPAGFQDPANQEMANMIYKVGDFETDNKMEAFKEAFELAEPVEYGFYPSEDDEFECVDYFDHADIEFLVIDNQVLKAA